LASQFPFGLHDPVESASPPQHRFQLEQVLRERTADLGIPVGQVAGGPDAPGNGALPRGGVARLDATRPPQR